MFLDANAKKNICIITIHVSLSMYGDVFLRVEEKGKEQIQVSWLAIGDVGTVFDEGSKEIKSLCFSAVVDNISAVKFPEQENESMSLLWEIHFGDRDGSEVAGVDAGHWSDGMIRCIVDKISEILHDDEATGCLKEFVAF